jgi:hypothetical protein
VHAEIWGGGSGRGEKQGRVGSGSLDCWAGLGRRRMGQAQDEHYPFLFIRKFSKRLELIQSKDVLPVLENFQIKYSFEYFEIRNNFSYYDFSKFEIEVELKKLENVLGVEFE